MADTTLPLTFSIELQLVFAFHESLLQAHLDAGHPGAPIIKNLTPAQRTDLNQAPAEYRNAVKAYASWALSGQTTSAAAKTTADGTIRTYGDEPLHIANSILPAQLAYVHAGPGKARDLTQWHLVHETSLVGVDKETLRRKLGDRIQDLTAADDWDTYGLALTSRPLPTTPASFAEIDRTLSAITGTPTTQHGAFATPLCGLHVHVAVAPLPTLQNLAYLLTMYEPHISAMHPPHRQPGTAINLGSNRAAFTLDPPLATPTLTFDPASRTVARTTAYSSMQPLAAIRAAIFAPEMTLARLVALMGGEGAQQLVDWSGLLRGSEEGAATVEFRQHEGTVFPGSVKWWVLFVTGLVGLAGGLAARTAGVMDGPNWEAEAGVEGFAFKKWHANMSFVDLLEMMGFPEEGRAFLGGRVAFYAGGGGVEGDKGGGVEGGETMLGRKEEKQTELSKEGGGLVCLMSDTDFNDSEDEARTALKEE